MTLQGRIVKGGSVATSTKTKPSNSEIHIKSDPKELHFKTVRRDQSMEMERDNHQEKHTSTESGLAPLPGTGGHCSPVLKLGQPTHSLYQGISKQKPWSHPDLLLSWSSSSPANNRQVLSVLLHADLSEPSHSQCAHHFQPGPSYFVSPRHSESS